MKLTEDDKVKATISQLQKLLARHEELLQERARHSQLVKDLETEEKTLLETTDLEDKKQFEKISQLRLRRELLPRKIASFGEEAEGCLTELDNECAAAIRIYQDIIIQKMKTMKKEIAKGLLPFFTGRSGLAYLLIDELIPKTNAGTHMNNHLARLNSENLTKRLTRFKAEELIKMGPVLEGLQIYEPLPHEITGQKSHVQVLAHELQTLTDAPEEAILRKMKYGLTREQAVAAVEARMKKIKSELEPPPAPEPTD
jgi:hypothetical protein